MARSMRLARDMYIVLLLHLAWALMAVPVVTRQQRVPASAATWLALILLLMQRKRVLLVDGPFIAAQKNLSLRFRGSSNQRLIDMPKTLAAGTVVLWDERQ